MEEWDEGGVCEGDCGVDGERIRERDDAARRRGASDVEDGV